MASLEYESPSTPRVLGPLGQVQRCLKRPSELPPTVSEYTARKRANTLSEFDALADDLEDVRLRILPSLSRMPALKSRLAGVAERCQVWLYCHTHIRGSADAARQRRELKVESERCLELFKMYEDLDIVAEAGRELEDLIGR